MRLSKRETALLIVLGIVVIIVLGVNFLILPMGREMNAARAELLTKSDEMISVKADVELSGEMAQALQAAYAQTGELKKPYENSMKQEEVDLWLNTLLAKNGLEVQNMDISDIKVATADFESTALNQVESLPIQDAADIINGDALPAEEPDALAPAEDSAEQPAQASQETGAGALYQIDAIINCQGSLDSIIAFANDLYASGRALRVTTLETQQAGEGGKVPGVVIVEFYGIPAVDGVTQAGTGDAE